MTKTCTKQEGGALRGAYLSLIKKFLLLAVGFSVGIPNAYALVQVVDPAITLSANNPQEDVTINIEQGSDLFDEDGVLQVNTIILKAFDPDFVNEGQLIINGGAPIDLFPGGDGNFDGQEVDITFDLPPGTVFNIGANTLSFRHTNTQGYEIRGITLLGGEGLPIQLFASIAPQMGSAITPNRKRAQTLAGRLAGIKIPIDHPMVIEMEQLLNSGDAAGAAEVATHHPGFYNFVVKDMAAKMSNRDTSSNTPLNDFVATFIGVARDDENAQGLLHADYFYMGDPAKAAVPSNLADDVIQSNNHYLSLEAGAYDLSKVLVKVDRQKALNENGDVVDMPDAAGVITSRSYVETNASAGTNRRMVEWAFSEFLCARMEQWADATRSDERVARDVSRAPGGEIMTYQTNCKSCHGQMDSLRGAFAKLDFVNGMVVNADLYSPQSGEDIRIDSNGIMEKYHSGADAYPAGYITTDTSWRNIATSNANQVQFGWQGILEGAGVKQFGQMVSRSDRFASCLTERVFESVCHRAPAADDKPAIDAISQSFKSGGYKLRTVFAGVAARPECLGQ